MQLETEETATNIKINNSSNKTDKNKPEFLKISIMDILKNSTVHATPNMLRTKSFVFKLIGLFFSSYQRVPARFTRSRASQIIYVSVINEIQPQFPTISVCGYPFLNKSIDKLILDVKFDGDSSTDFNQYFGEFEDPICGKCFRFNSGKNKLGKSIAILNSTVWLFKQTKNTILSRYSRSV